jgi:hypothetical protein
MSQHIGNNHQHHQKTKYSYTTFGSQKPMSTHIYIYRNRMFVYKNMGPLARATSGYNKTGSPA